MDNLQSSGLNLRNIKLRDLNTLVSDIQYNFQQIVQLPGFKGVTGKDGLSITGATGERGNKWVFANSASFITEYVTVTTSGQVTLNFLNSQLTADLARLLTTLGIDKLVGNDIIVLPSRDVIQFSSLTNEFVSTGIRFADGLSLNEEEVIEIINEVLGGLNNNDVYGIYKGIIKNYADNSAGLNNQSNYNSIIDLPVSGSGIGLETNDFIFSAIKEANIGNGVNTMFLTGSPKDYHNLAQKTLTNKTVDYMAGVDDFGALAVLQNSYKNGILIGHKDSNDFSTWGRIFRTENKLRFLSDYDPKLDEVGRLDLAKSGTVLFSPKDLQLMIKNGVLKMTDYKTNYDWLDATSERMVLGNANLPYVSIYSKNYAKLYTSIGANTQILGLYGNELKASIFQPKNDLLVNDQNLLVTHNILFDIKEDLETWIDDLDDRVSILESQNVYRQQTRLVGNANANLLTQFGLYDIRYNSSASYTNFPNNTLSNGFATNAYLKVNRFDEGTNVVIEQEYVNKSASNNYLVTSKRQGISNDSGSTFTWSNWTVLLDSRNSLFKGDGLSIVIENETFGDSGKLVIKHKAGVGSKVEAENPTTDSHKVVRGLNLDSSGHPTSVIAQDLDEWYYDKIEIDKLLRSNLPIGTIVIWSGNPNTIPAGFILCDGNNDTPNYGGRFLVGYDATNTDYNVVGARGGEAFVTLTKAQMPIHSHGGVTGSGGVHDHTIRFRYSGAEQDNQIGFLQPEWWTDQTNMGESGGNGTDNGYVNVTIPSSDAHNHTIQSEGGGQAHENRPPYEVVCFIMFVGFGVPSVTSPTNLSTTVGLPFSVVPDSIGVVTSWSATNLPLGLSINPTTGEISGIPTTPSNNEVTLIATNSNGSSAPYKFFINVEPFLGSVPVITSGNVIDVEVGQSFSYRITASGDPTSFGATGLPSWMSLDTTTGFITGTVPLGTPQSLFEINVSAINGSGTGSQNVSVIVTSLATINAPLLIGGGLTRSFYTGESVSYSHINGGGTATNWSALGLPTGLSINASTGRITGTINFAYSGETFNVQVTASNAAGISTISYNIYVYSDFGGDFRIN
ncbi:tail collar domain [Tenacibaculum phage pT24]|uniref:Tail collar domain n=1 Tax=Tenacibaculum phage pT24 TaxID=1880590 RepID=A0A1B4XWX6_9CAUD|nr:tail fiber protein [Tenacibaculum phage pT24]BAV39304.1 tail collar domain [Tenacibaculum phage pT24]